MALTEVQRAYGYTSGSTGCTITLASQPQPGNLLVFVAFGNQDTVNPPTGFTKLYGIDMTQDATTCDYRRVVTSNEGTSYTKPVFASWDTAGVLIELAGAGTPFISGSTCYGDTAWSSSTHQMSSLSLSAPIGSYCFLGFSLQTGAASYSTSASITGSFTLDLDIYKNLSGTQGHEVVWAHKILASAGNTASTLTASSNPAPTGNQSFQVFYVPAADLVQPTDTRATFSDSPAVAMTRRPAPTDTRATFTDSPAISMAHTIAVTDTRSTFSDSPSMLRSKAAIVTDTRATFSDTPAISLNHALAITDTRASFSDSPSVTKNNAASLVRTNTTSADGGGATGSITLSSSTAAGNFLTAIVAVNNPSGTWTAPTGWTYVSASGILAGGSATEGLYAFTKVATSGDAGAVVTFTFPSGNTTNNYMIVVYEHANVRGIDTVTVANNGNSYSPTNTAATGTLTGTPTASGDAVIVVGAEDNAYHSSGAVPTGYTLDYSAHLYNGQSIQAQSYHRTANISGTTTETISGGLTWPNTSPCNVAGLMILLKPTAASTINLAVTETRTFSDSVYVADNTAVAVSEVQRAVAYNGTGTSVNPTLASTPTIGNTIVLVLLGSAGSGTITGFTPLLYNNATTQDDVVVWYRVVTGASEPTSYSIPCTTGWETVGLALELHNAGTPYPSTGNSGDQAWSSSSTSMPGFVVTAPVGSYGFSGFGVHCGSVTTFTPNGTLSNGFTKDSDTYSNTSGNGGEFVLAHKVYTTAGDTTTTLTASNNPAGTGNQSNVAFVVPYQVIRNLTVTDTRATFSDSASVTHGSATVDSVNVTDTRSAFTDSAAISVAHSLVPTDTRTFSDSVAVVDTPTGSQNRIISITDTRAPFSDSAARQTLGTVTEVQRAYAYNGTAFSTTLTLPATPTAGNLLVIVFFNQASYPPVTPTGFTEWVNTDLTTQDAYALWTRVVQPGDSASVPIACFSSPYDGAGVIVELSGASSTPTFTGGDANFNTTTKSISTGNVTVPTGGYLLAGISLYTGPSTYTASGTTLSNSFTLDQENFSNANATHGSDFIFAHRSASSPLTTNVTSTTPGMAGLVTGNNTVILVGVSPAAGQTDNVTVTDTRSTFSDTALLSKGVTLVPSDTRSAFSDSVAVIDQGHGVFATDTRSAFSDSVAISVAHSLFVSDTRTFSDSPGVQDQIPVGGNHAIPLTETRSAFSDTPAVLNIKATPKAPSFGSAMVPGSVNKKYLVYLGLLSPDRTKFSVVPRGTFIATSAAGIQDKGLTTQTLHGYDLVREFNFPVYTDFPHPMYGNQTDTRYDPQYNLTNPSLDGKTWVHDAKLFMTATTDNTFFSANFQNIFGAVVSGSPVNVFVGTPTTPATTPVAASTYTWNPATGTVTFNSAQPSNAVISIDGVPQAMAPELMIKHLFVDFAGWNVNAMNLQTSNTLLPTYVGGRGTALWQIAQDITAMTAPRNVAWKIRIDEYGQINFYESRVAATPVATLIDERDLFNINYTLTTEALANVVTADSVSNTNQPIKSISYSIPSIAANGQRAPYQIPANQLLVTRGMSSATAISVMNTLTASALYEKSRPTLELTCDILPNYSFQVGDKITIIERSIGLSGPYIIAGIDDRISLGQHTMSVRLQQAHIFANFNMGLPSAVSSATQQTALTTPAALSGKTGILTTFSINGVNAITNGAIALDSFGNAVIPQVFANMPWTFSFNIDKNQASDTVLFHYLYMECPNSLTSNSAMAIRLSGFPDGTIIPAATVGAGYGLTKTRTGTSLNAGETAYLYNQIVLAANASNLQSGYNAVTATLTNTATAAQYLNPTTSYGIGYGPQFTGSYAFLPNQKQNYAYFCLMACNANGATSYYRIPFIVSN